MHRVFWASTSLSYRVGALKGHIHWGPAFGQQTPSTGKGSFCNTWMGLVLNSIPCGYQVVQNLKCWASKELWGPELAHQSVLQKELDALATSAKKVKPGEWDHRRLVNVPHATKVGGKKSSLSREHSVSMLSQIRTNTLQNVWHFSSRQVQVHSPFSAIIKYKILWKAGAFLSLCRLHKLSDKNSSDH